MTVIFSLNLKKLILKFVFLWLILGAASFFITHKINYFKKRLWEIEAGWKNTEPVLKQRDSLSKRRQELGSFLVLLNEAFKRDIFWSEKLTALTHLVPDEAWLKAISFRKEGKEPSSMFLDILAAVGYSKRDEELLDKINNFIDGLKQDNNFFKDFNNLSLLEINKAKEGAEGNVMDFKLTLSLK